MSRTIDADALVRILESCRDTAPVLGLQSIIAIDDAIQMVIDAPTIPAIPVDWIKNRLNAMLKGTASAESCFAVQIMLVDWWKEQEAR